ncbi:MAG: hypothetical protein Q7K39_00770 [Candidatus Magasanikbacteria bacterium]|nr:hypothetical protein [Candidatus Magasanikbacteria bacterium]
MAEPRLTLNEFFVEGGNQNISHVLLHITEPSTEEEKRKGYFFAICEINRGSAPYIASIQATIDEIETNYYALSDHSEKNSLELALEKINQRASALLSEGVALNCLVGAIRQPEIIFSTCGSPTLLLFYKNRQGLFRSLNLLEAPGGENSGEGQELFSQIVQGKISPNDFLFAATPHVNNFFTGDRLEKIITTRSARQSAEHLERVLKELRSEFSFGGLIIHLAEATQKSELKKSRPTAAGGSAESLKTMFNTESNTSATLSPTLFNKMKARLTASQFAAVPSQAEFTAKQSDFNSAEIRAAHVHRLEKHRPDSSEATGLTSAWDTLTEFLLAAGRLALRGLWIGLQIILLVIGKIGRALALLFVVAANLRGRRQIILEDWLRQWRFYKRSLAELPIITKIIIAGAILISLTFVGSLIYLRSVQISAAREAVYQDNLRQITTKKEAAESSLVYKNESAALNEVSEARELLKNLACDNKEKAATCAELQNALDVLLLKARKITIVQPELLTNWGNNNTSQLIKISNKLFSFAATSTDLYLFDLFSRATKILPQNQIYGGFVAGAVPKENDYAVLLNNRGEAITLSPSDNSTKPIEVGFESEHPNIGSALVYNRRLYSLDKSLGQIYRHDATKTGFGLGKEWLDKPDENLKNASGFTIDGDLFALLNNGQIAKHTGGVNASFTVSGLDPAISGTGAIYSYNDVAYLYVLDTTLKRLVILEKDGRFKAQLVATEFAYPTGLAVDEPNKTAYILDSGKLFKINLPI